MNARAAIAGLTLPTHKSLLADFRQKVLGVLGLNGTNEANILDHAVGSACIELEVIASALTSPVQVDAEMCGLALRNVIERLRLARELQSGLWHPEHPEHTLIPRKEGDS